MNTAIHTTLVHAVMYVCMYYGHIYSIIMKQSASLIVRAYMHK